MAEVKARAQRRAYSSLTPSLLPRGCAQDGLRHFGFLPLSPRDGARFAAGFARCGCGLRSLGFYEFGVRRQGFDPSARVKSGNSRAKTGIRGLQMNNLDRLPPRKPGVLTKK